MCDYAAGGGGDVGAGGAFVPGCKSRRWPAYGGVSAIVGAIVRGVCAIVRARRSSALVCAPPEVAAPAGQPGAGTSPRDERAPGAHAAPRRSDVARLMTI